MEKFQNIWIIWIKAIPLHHCKCIIMYKTPILLIIFRRKDVALKCLERIRKVLPTKLYIAGDGARANVVGEQESVEATRKAVLDAIDWPCEVNTLFQTENLGCSKGVITAINWLFTNEEQGIILEDDCMMQGSFFPFVEELLERYKNDERIGMIDGANYIKDIVIPDSYGNKRMGYMAQGMEEYGHQYGLAQDAIRKLYHSQYGLSFTRYQILEIPHQRSRPQRR